MPFPVFDVALDGLRLLDTAPRSQVSPEGGGARFRVTAAFVGLLCLVIVTVVAVRSALPPGGQDAVAPASLARSVAPTTTPSGRRTHVFLLAGSSNMVGQAPYDGAGGYPAGVWQYPLSGALESVENASMLQYPAFYLGTVYTDMGLTITFAVEFLQDHPGDTLVLVPMAEKYSTVELDWYPLDFGIIGFDWEIDALFTFESFTLLNNLFEQHPDFEFAGILWHGGEDEALRGYPVSSHITDLQLLMHEIRSWFGEASARAPVVVGGLSETLLDIEGLGDEMNIGLAGLVDLLSYSAYAGSAGLGALDPDVGEFFDAAALREFGSRYYTAWKAAVQNAPTVPVAPEGLTVQSGSTFYTLLVQWTLVRGVIGLPSTYVVQQSLDGSQFTEVTGLDPTLTQHVLQNLAGGVTYYFRVAAVNDIGTGPFSGVASGVPDAPTLPGEIQSIVVQAATVTLYVAWGNIIDTGGLPLTYILQQSLDGIEFTDVTRSNPSVTSQWVDDLTGGVTYYFRVAAVNDVGTGPFSAVASGVPHMMTLPGAPEGVTVSPLKRALHVRWSRPSDTGASVFGVTMTVPTTYNVEQSLDGNSFTEVGSTPFNVQSYIIQNLLVNVTYYFRVSATNQAGTGPFSSTASGVADAPTVPGAPEDVVVSPLVNALFVQWSAPSDTGGLPLTYIMQQSLGGDLYTEVTGSPFAATSHTVSNLTGGVTYYLRVAAVNDLGTGAFSSNVTGHPIVYV